MFKHAGFNVMPIKQKQRLTFRQKTDITVKILKIQLFERYHSAALSLILAN